MNHIKELKPSLNRLEQSFRAQIAGIVRLGVAFSAGVDSTVLLALAARALGADEVVAITGVSASLAERELGEARQLCQLLGVSHVELPTRELEMASYRRNGLDRCFHCKNELFNAIDDGVRVRHRLDAIAYGETTDDLARTDRPGAAAARQHAVLSPLAAAGIDKSGVRALARALELPNADKPAAPCLASRIPFHQSVTIEKLGQVERAERLLREAGLTDVRVRHHDRIARIELAEQDWATLADPTTRERIVAGLRALGFDRVSVDLQPLRSGSLWELVTRP